jgi:hypothetical protein
MGLSFVGQQTSFGGYCRKIRITLIDRPRVEALVNFLTFYATLKRRSSTVVAAFGTLRRASLAQGRLKN